MRRSYGCNAALIFRFNSRLIWHLRQMMKPIPFLGMIAIAATMIAPSAFALSAKGCNAAAKTLTSDQAKAKKMVAEREALVQEVEDAGDTWEDAEALRLFSPDQAAQADAARVTYESLKADLMADEAELQSFVAGLNQRANDYNRTCATKRR